MVGIGRGGEEEFFCLQERFDVTIDLCVSLAISQEWGIVYWESFDELPC